MLRTTLLAAIAAIVLPAATALASTSWTTSGVNFRSGPGSYYDLVGYLPKCAKLVIYEYQDGWVLVDWDGSRGWVSGRYLSDSNAHCGNGGKKSSGGYSSGY